MTSIRFTATLRRPASPPSATWLFVVLPKTASAKLPTRGTVAVEGTFAGVAFAALAVPDGQGGHWLKIDRPLRDAAAANPGDKVAFVIAPAADEPEPDVPADLRTALAAAEPATRAAWTSLKPGQRRDWIDWITMPKKPETRAKRIAAARDMLGSGKRRVCCFDRSGIYGGGFAAPAAAPDDS